MVYLATRSAVREAVLDDADVFVFDADRFDGVATPIRWVVTMTTEAAVGIVGGVPDTVSDLVDGQFDRPLDDGAVESLTDRLRDRRSSLRALDDGPRPQRQAGRPRRYRWVKRTTRSS